MIPLSRELILCFHHQLACWLPLPFVEDQLEFLIATDKLELLSTRDSLKFLIAKDLILLPSLAFTLSSQCAAVGCPTKPHTSLISAMPILTATYVVKTTASLTQRTRGLVHHC